MQLAKEVACSWRKAREREEKGRDSGVATGLASKISGKAFAVPGVVASSSLW